MRMSKAQLELAKKRGATIVTPKTKSDAVEPAPPQPVSTPPADVQLRQLDALVLNSSTTLTVIEQVKLLAESISKSVLRKPQPAPTPPGYRFKVIRDKNNRMVEIEARPIERE